MEGDWQCLSPRISLGTWGRTPELLKGCLIAPPDSASSVPASSATFPASGVAEERELRDTETSHL